MRNWKTTVTGLVGGVLIFIGGVLKDRAVNPVAPPITPGNVIPGAVIAAIGILAKDGDK